MSSKLTDRQENKLCAAMPDPLRRVLRRGARQRDNKTCWLRLLGSVRTSQPQFYIGNQQTPLVSICGSWDAHGIWEATVMVCFLLPYEPDAPTCSCTRLALFEDTFSVGVCVCFSFFFCCFKLVTHFESCMQPYLCSDNDLGGAVARLHGTSLCTPFLASDGWQISSPVVV
jgi:hypothetical protein